MADSIGKMQLSNQDLRENFNVARRMIAMANGVDISKVASSQLTQGFIRTYVNLVVTQSQFQWNISSLDNYASSPNLPITNLVASVDAFVAGAMGYYLLNYSWTGGAGAMQNIDFTTSNCFVPITYPSNWFNNSSSNSLDNGCFMFWMGYIKIEVNSIVLYKTWDLMRHLYVPRTQASPAAGLTPAVQLQSKDQFDGSADTFFPMEPLPVFSGSKQSVVTVQYPANIPNIKPFSLGSIGYGTSFVLLACLHFRGVNCQNASSLK